MADGWLGCGVIVVIEGMWRGLEERVRRLEGELQRERERTITAATAATAGDHGGSDVRVSPPTPSPVDEGARDHSPNASDLESYMINTHDGKMRFFGELVQK